MFASRKWRWGPQPPRSARHRNRAAHRVDRTSRRLSLEHLERRELLTAGLQAALSASSLSAAASAGHTARAPAPVVAAIMTAAGPTAGGTAVTITGTGLAGATAVRFGGKAAKITSDTATQIVAVSPVGTAGTIDVRVVTPGGTSAKLRADKFTYTAVPIVTQISPTFCRATGGSAVTITGMCLTHATAVYFGGTPAKSFVVQSATQIWALSPPGAGTVDVTVVTPRGTSTTLPADWLTYATAIITTLAGSPEQLGSADGSGSAVRFGSPAGVAFDSAGNAYVADTANNEIRKITTAGVVLTFAGLAGHTGSADGTWTQARFNSPTGVAVDSVGNIYVADSGNDEIREISSQGVVTTLAGAAGQAGYSDGTGSGALFDDPTGMAWDSTTGNVYVADTGNGAIREITSAGVVNTLAAGFNLPTGVAVDSAGNVYVADSGNDEIYKIITSTGLVTRLAGVAGQSGSSDGIGRQAEFNDPTGLAVDSAGNVYVADTGNDEIREITPSDVVTALAGSPVSQGSSDGPAGQARFYQPEGLAVNSVGSLYVADTGNDEVRRINTYVSPVLPSVTAVGPTAGPLAGGTTVTITGTDLTGATAVYFGGTPATSYSVQSATKITAVAPPGTSAVNVVVVTPFGVSPIAVADQFTYAAPPAVTGISSAYGLATGGAAVTITGQYLSGATAVYFGGTAAASYSVESDTQVTAVSPAGQIGTADVTVVTAGGSSATSAADQFTYVPFIVTTIAGSAGRRGSSDGTGSQGLFACPTGAAVDSAGNLYVADSGNDEIRKITPAGAVTTLAGSPMHAGPSDGTGSQARFDCPQGAAVDSAGNVYVADSGNDEIRKITPAGVVTTFAGAAGQPGSSDGSGSGALFDDPTGVAVDSAGNVYVADSGNDEIREITPAGVVSTLAGSAGQQGYSDGTGSDARFDGPEGVAVYKTGNVYVADSGNDEIREITPAGVVTTLAGAAGQWGSSDGPGSQAKFWGPGGVAVRNAGSIYVADSRNDDIREITLVTAAGQAAARPSLACRAGVEWHARQDRRRNPNRGSVGPDFGIAGRRKRCQRGVGVGEQR